MRNKSSTRRKAKINSFKKVFLILGAIILALLFVKLIIVFKNSLWDGAERINFVVNGKNTSLVSFEPTEKTLTFLEIPNNTLLEVTHGYGEYQLSAIARLGDLEKRKNLLSETLQENLALPVSGYIQDLGVQENDVNSRNNLNDILIEGLVGKNQTNLSSWDILRLWWQIRTVKETDVLIFNLEKRDLLTAKTLAEKTKVFSLDTPIFDLKMQNLLPILALKKDNLTIEILNSTGVPGLADKTARILNNIGTRVVSTGNMETEIQKSLLKGNKNLKNTKTVEIVKKLFNCDWQDTDESGRADLTLIIGHDYFEKLQEK
jgi:hypothetical protein